MGWSELQNGELLRVAEEAGFELLLSGDKKLVSEQNMAGHRIAVVCMSDNHWPIVRNHVAAIGNAVDAGPAGNDHDCQLRHVRTPQVQAPLGPRVG